MNSSVETPPISITLKAKARAAGLLAPHVGEAFGGMGLNHRQIATVFRAAGYSTLGPVALNIMAPDEGNMALLEKVASPAQQDRFLRPLAEGRSAIDREIERELREEAAAARS